MRGRNFRPQKQTRPGRPPQRQVGDAPVNPNHVFDSRGPETRIRGTAQQIYERYTALARDAAGTGDHVAAEGYFQHAEHYFRIIGAMALAAQAAESRRGAPVADGAELAEGDAD